MKNEIWTSKQSSNGFIKLHAQQSQNLSARSKRTKEDKTKKKEKTKTMKQHTGAPTGDMYIQIVATVHFDPKLLSREILER